MKRFFCLCGQEVHFHDHYCLACGRDLGYDPQGRFVWSGEIAKDGLFHAHVPGGGQMTYYRFCQNREVVSCNWLLSPSEPAAQCQCVSCRTTRTIPDQSQPKNPRRWRLLEQAKRQLMHTLLELRLIDAAGGCSIEGLVFDFLEDKRTNPQVELEHVLTGHDNGLITLNAAEADEGFLYAMKEQMQERYRSLLGHFRHEIGHYFWLRLLQTEVSKSAFREVFGDERQDYAEALKHYYRLGKQTHWRSRFITPYASSHPFEDWAETWAHYLHIFDTLQTAVAYGLSACEPKQGAFDEWFAEWGRVTEVMNALNRSMGLAEPYPFVVSDVVKGKLRFIDEMINLYRIP